MSEIGKAPARNVTRLRKGAGLSHEAFADHAGIHRTYIGASKRAAQNPTIEIVERLTKALGVRPGELLSHEN